MGHHSERPVGLQHTPEWDLRAHALACPYNCGTRADFPAVQVLRAPTWHLSAVYVYICIYIHMNIRICTYSYISMYTSIKLWRANLTSLQCICVCTYIHTYTYVYYIYVNTYLPTHRFTFARQARQLDISPLHIYICTYVHTYTYIIYIHKYIWTYTYIYI